MQVATTRFGVLEVGPEQLLSFPSGLIGLPELRQFFFVPVSGNRCFIWMQSTARPEIAFLMADPFPFFPGYRPDLDDQICREMGILKPEDALLLTVVTVPREGVRGMTANLLAPVVINHRERTGRQVILDRSGYRTRHRLFPDQGPGGAAAGDHVGG